ncbi:Uncharacterized protein BM_BM10431 [Brugia malayi]|uniref:Bm10431, isoform c n=1 Tax=Brugia malayi TaxID=6279 RepID=A0A1P6BGG8_BRUMA|nr:Uncharacterized protein BM_BM10431 [Brugia malayi]CDP98116.1 Bm10431, isoform c [Brugia malayi]VIO93873.1 Uncharacterized protein BM_BM10431 [Brugia malayi]
MGCQSSKQGEHTKIGKSKLDANENANVASQPAIEKLPLEQSNKEVHAERVTFSTEELNDEMGNSALEPEANYSAALKVKTTVSRSMEPNEEAISNWKQSRRNKLHKHSLQRSPGSSKGRQNGAEEIRKMTHYMKYLLKCRNSTWYHLSQKIMWRNDILV